MMAMKSAVGGGTPVTIGGGGPPSVVKEGWLNKRGKHIKTWRKRYFILKDDGTLLGYRSNTDPSQNVEPTNNFTVQKCQIMTLDKPKPYTFIIRGLQWTQTVERTFHVDSEEERQSWTKAITNVANRIEPTESTHQFHHGFKHDDFNDVDMACIAEEGSDFQLQVGTSTGKISGKKKVVSIFCVILGHPVELSGI